MDILKSNKRQQEFIAGAYVFSGRPDPEWNVREEIVNKLKQIWNSLEMEAGKHEPAPSLGYRGCYLRYKPDIEWFVYSGVVTKKTAKGHESRVDNNRRIERLILSSAPEGILPKGIL